LNQLDIRQVYEKENVGMYGNSKSMRKRTLRFDDPNVHTHDHSDDLPNNEYLKRFTLPKPTFSQSKKLRNYDETKQRKGIYEENKVGNVVNDKEQGTPNPTASCIKRMSEHPRQRLRKIWDKGNECRRSALEFRKRRQVLKNFALKNIQLAKPIWIELLAEQINRDISFVDYVPEDHSYKVKPSYLDLVKDLITSQLSKVGIAEKMIEVPFKYTVTSLSLQNFLQNNYYNEEIINALLSLYQDQAHSHGYLVFSTLSYHTICQFINHPSKESD
jgi:hypothetical protein